MRQGFSTLYTTLPHNLKGKTSGFGGVGLRGALGGYGSLCLACGGGGGLFSFPLTKVGVRFGHVGMCATPCPVSLVIFVLDLGPGCADGLLEFRWVQVERLSWLIYFILLRERFRGFSLPW